jgi:cytochrome P450
MAQMRSRCPVAHSDQYQGHWVITRYEDVLRVAQDWKTFSSARGVGVTEEPMIVPPLPLVVDPPIQRTYRRLINTFFTPAVVSEYERPLRALVTRLIGAFVREGNCEFMSEFARPLPGLAFFEQVLHAPPDEVPEINNMSTIASIPHHPRGREAWEYMFVWITAFVADRRHQPPRDDVVDAILPLMSRDDQSATTRSMV